MVSRAAEEGSWRVRPTVQAEIRSLVRISRPRPHSVLDGRPMSGIPFPGKTYI